MAYKLPQKKQFKKKKKTTGNKIVHKTAKVTRNFYRIIQRQLQMKKKIMD